LPSPDAPSAYPPRLPLTLSVLVCTFRRPNDLLRCLNALAVQTRLPDEVIVVHRADDAQTIRFLTDRPAAEFPLRMIATNEIGVVAARNAGLAACRTDLMSQIDDDTAPHPDWAERIVAHFQDDPVLGGLSGRDRVYDGQAFDETRAPKVGILEWYGRVIGNHHRGVGPARPVQVFKGANMTFRSAATAGLRFDERLRGRGAQPHEDVAFSLAVGRRGWRLVYDPQVLVDHYAARHEIRPYSSVGAAGDAGACGESAFNMVVALWDELGPVRRIAFLLWSSLVGTGPEPGFLQAVRYTPRAGLASWQRFWITQRGKWSAFLVLSRRETQRGPGAALAGDAGSS
jgi:GT2 family glycosyltransferase